MNKVDKGLVVFYLILTPIHFGSLYGIYKNTKREEINREKIRKLRREYEWGSTSVKPSKE